MCWRTHLFEGCHIGEAPSWPKEKTGEQGRERRTLRCASRGSIAPRHHVGSWFTVMKVVGRVGDARSEGGGCCTVVLEERQAQTPPITGYGKIWKKKRGGGEGGSGVVIIFPQQGCGMQGSGERERDRGREINSMRKMKGVGRRRKGGVLVGVGG